MRRGSFTARPATSDSAFLSQLLAEAASKAGDKPVVVVVDALDEADEVGLAPTTNRLYLPTTLPPGVVFVVTSQDLADYRLDVSQQVHVDLRNDDPRNLDDMRTYVSNYMRSHPELAPQVAAWKVTDDEFMDIIISRSQGNFMYLVYVLDDIRSGLITAETIDNVRDTTPGAARLLRAAMAQPPWR